MFKTWLYRAVLTDDPAGDLIGDMRMVDEVGRRPVPFDQFKSLEALRGYLRWEGACREAIEAAAPVWRRYRIWQNRRGVSG